MELQNHWQAGVHANVQPTVQSRGADTSTGVDRVLIIAYRKKKKESQRQFWARFGVTQSRGSRFESGAEIPAPVSILLGLYFTKTVTDGDLGRAEKVLHNPEAREFINLDQ
ncbi:helix-turn-helix domain-containing protein [Paraburkholderia caribensis]|uniref:helix-turn-helix domain-containing protein n=1 Tax=Paraburkholderia caribensis TaxID=75105 RepID=UPI00071F0D16|nr:helix-turn-helix transcriptional regulator [Paraburkholderia caribensis]ALP65014.1 hypothetical protein AN416_20595 [Paraburkholderia caribensis]AUT53839.1 XRE family transcriptional regulator [Paraburkholderia caribensis]